MADAVGDEEVVGVGGESIGCECEEVRECRSKIFVAGVVSVLEYVDIVGVGENIFC